MINDDLYLEQILVGPMENFIYLIGSKRTREVALIDPAWDVEGLLNHIHARDLKLSCVLVTHYHPDHVGGGWAAPPLRVAQGYLSRNLLKPL